MQTKLATLEKSVTLSNLAVTGGSTFTVNEDLTSTMTFDDLIISYDASAVPAGSLPNWHCDIDVSGSVVGTLKLLSGNSTDIEFTWEDGAVITCEAKTNTIVDGIGSIPFDIPMDQQYGSGILVSYSCEGNKLFLSGTTNGKYAWAYSYNRA